MLQRRDSEIIVKINKTDDGWRIKQRFIEITAVVELQIFIYIPLESIESR